MEIETEAPVRSACAESLTVSAPSSGTGEPPPLKVAVAPAVICGPTTRSIVLVAVLLPAKLVAWSTTCQDRVRVPVLAMVELKVIESSAV